MRLLTESDMSEALEMLLEPNAWDYIGSWKDKTKHEYEGFLKLKLTEIESREGFYWVIRHTESGALIGGINVTPIPKTQEMQIGWMIRETFQRQGYALEAAQLAMEFVEQSTNIDVIYAVYDIENVASEKIIQKLGFQFYTSFSEGKRTLNKYRSLRDHWIV